MNKGTQKVGPLRKPESPGELQREGRRPEKGGLFARLFGRKRESRFVIILNHEASFEKLLESLWLARRFRQSTPEGKVIAIAASAYHSFLLRSGFVNECIPFPEEQTHLSRKIVKKQKPDAIYFPYSHFSDDWKLRRLRIKIRLGSGRSPVYSRLVGFQMLESPLPGSSREWFPEQTVLEPILYPFTPTSTPKERRVVVDLSGSDGLIWPAGHTARLMRLLKQSGVKATIPLGPGSNISESDLTYLRRQLDHNDFIEYNEPDQLVSSIGNSDLVIGPHGPGVWLGGLLGKPVLALHTRSSRSMTRLLHSVKSDNAAGLKPSTRVARLRRPLFPAYSRDRKTVKHLIPEGRGECPAVCNGCDSSDCIQRISPERVFDEARRILAV